MKDCQFGVSPVNYSDSDSDSEVINEARIEGKPLYLVTIDTQKAFDCTNHVILKKTLFEEGVAPDLWTIVDKLYSRMPSRVKWQGEYSDSFAIGQGVRQGEFCPHINTKCTSIRCLKT